MFVYKFVVNLTVLQYLYLAWTARAFPRPRNQLINEHRCPIGKSFDCPNDPIPLISFSHRCQPFWWITKYFRTSCSLIKVSTSVSTSLNVSAVFQRFVACLKILYFAECRKYTTALSFVLSFTWGVDVWQNVNDNIQKSNKNWKP